MSEGSEKGGENHTPPQGEYISDNDKYEALKEKLHRDFLIQSPSGRIQLDYEAELKEAKKEITIDKVGDILSSTIKKDEINKKILFLGCLLNYTSQDQQCFAFNAPSSTGKSYIAQEVIKFFPEEDKEIHAYTSPKAFYHEMSVLTNLQGEKLTTRNQYVENGLTEWAKRNPKPPKGKGVKAWREQRRIEKVKLKNEWDAIEKVYRVDLEQVILVFLDMPHDELLKSIRSLLSHDRKIIPVKIVDKTKSGGNRTKHIWLIGYPTVIFLSANFHYDEQERTRFWILSPEMSQDKFNESIELQSKVLSNREAFERNLKNNRERQLLKRRIKAIKEENINEILLREEDRKEILKRFKEKHQDLVPRHQRDFPRLIALIKAHALLNCFIRDKTEDGKAIYANEKDINVGFELAEKITKSNELGLPPYLYNFYKKALKQKLEELDPDGITRREYSALYFETMKHRLGEKAMRNQIRLLEDAGLIIEEYDPDNRRRKKIYTPEGGVSNSPPQSENPNLKEKMNKLLKIIRESKGIYETDLAKKSRINYKDRKKLIAQLKRDKAIIEPHPGFYKEAP